MIRLEHVHKSFGTLEVLRDVSLEVQTGEVVCIIGPSGAGKSTLLRCINHLEGIDSGTIYLNGQPVYRYQRDGKVVVDPDRRIEEHRSEVGMVFQSFNLFPHLSAIENIMLAPVHVRGEPPAEVRRQALALLAKVGLSDKVDAYPEELSGGQQQRVAIARALINNPTLLLADEPTGALDTHSGDQVMDLLARLHRDGQTILLVTHDAKLATRHASRVVSVMDGKIVDDARLDTTERPAADVVRVRGEESSR